MTVKKLTPKDKKDIDAVIANFRLEGMEPPECVVDFLEMRALDQITAEQYQQYAKKIALGEMTAQEALSDARRTARK